MKKILPAAVLAALLAGCTLMQSDPPPPIQFNYVTSAPGESGLVRVFNLNGNTILQFTDLVAVQPKVYRSDSPAPLTYTVVGQYAVVAGQHPMLRIEANGTAVNALQLASTQPVPMPAQLASTPAAPATAAAGLAESPAPVEIAAATDTAAAADPKMEQLKRELEQARKDLAAAKQDLASLQKVNIEPFPVLPPLDESRRPWTLQGQKTLKDNMATLAKTAGYGELNWKASNPFMVRGTTTYPALTFLEFLQKITETVPALEFKVSKTRRTVDVIDAGKAGA